MYLDPFCRNAMYGTLSFFCTHNAGSSNSCVKS